MFNSNASSASSDANYIEDVFSTYLRAGTNTTANVVNGIDLSTKGGMVWFKARNQTGNNTVYDTVRGAGKYLYANLTNAENTNLSGYDLTAFNSNGYTLGTPEIPGVNDSPYLNVAWAFREQAKFFDVVTYTGNGTSQNIAHSLGSVPGCIMVKATSGVSNWFVYHRSLGNANLVYLNTTSASASTTIWNSTDPTSTQFSINGTSGNASGVTYVAYIFAHDAGGFGLTGTDNVISCGSFSSNDAANGAVVNLGYEPQWVLIKSTGIADSWNLYDTMRGMPVGSDGADLNPNTSGAETVTRTVSPTATGFIANNGWGTGYNFIYIAIRRGPMKVPTDGTSVFSPVANTQSSGTVRTIGFPADLAISTGRTTNLVRMFNDRLRGFSLTNTSVGPRLFSNDTSAESSSFTGVGAVTNTGYQDGDYFDAGISMIRYLFGRAPSFFDEVCYTGTGTAGQTFSHNLGAVPDMMIVKSRSATGRGWMTYVSALGNTDCLELQATRGTQASVNYWNNTSPTSSVFSLGAGGDVNLSGATFVAYLFATCAGVSKVGSYTGTATTQQVNCGFAAGARFVMIKRTDSTGDWYVWDSARGIVAGNDPYLLLNSGTAEVTSTDYVDTYAAGFELSSTAPAALNASGGTYIFLAIA